MVNLYGPTSNENLKNITILNLSLFKRLTRRVLGLNISSLNVSIVLMLLHQNCLIGSSSARNRCHPTFSTKQANSSKFCCRHTWYQNFLSCNSVVYFYFILFTLSFDTLPSHSHPDLSWLDIVSLVSATRCSCWH